MLGSRLSPGSQLSAASQLCPVSQLSAVSQLSTVPYVANFLVLAKSYWNGSRRIVAFDDTHLFDINVSKDYMHCIQPGYTYQFQLLNPWDPTVVASMPVAVQGEPLQVEMTKNNIFAALRNIASISFRSMYPNIGIQGGKPYMNVGYEFQTPKAFLVQGNWIKKQRMNDGTTRCIINTDVGEIDIRYTGEGPDSYKGLPEVYDPNLVMRYYTLILVVADPLSNPLWSETRNYILVVAIY